MALAQPEDEKCGDFAETAAFKVEKMAHCGTPSHQLAVRMCIRRQRAISGPAPARLIRAQIEEAFRV